MQVPSIPPTLVLYICATSRVWADALRLPCHSPPTMVARQQHIIAWAALPLPLRARCWPTDHPLPAAVCRLLPPSARRHTTCARTGTCLMVAPVLLATFLPSLPQPCLGDMACWQTRLSVCCVALAQRLSNIAIYGGIILMRFGCLCLGLKPSARSFSCNSLRSCGILSWRRRHGNGYGDVTSFLSDHASHVTTLLYAIFASYMYVTFTL